MDIKKKIMLFTPGTTSLLGVRVGLGVTAQLFPDWNQSALYQRPASKGNKSDSLYCIHAVKSPKNDP